MAEDASSIQERFDRLELAAEEGRTCRRSWTCSDGVQERLSALLHVAPECRISSGGGDPSRCPVRLMPSWFAHLTVWIDDSGSDLLHREKLVRYARVMRNATVAFRKEDWEHLELKIRRLAVSWVAKSSGDDLVSSAASVAFSIHDAGIASKVWPSDEQWSTSRQGIMQLHARAVDRATSMLPSRIVGGSEFVDVVADDNSSQVSCDRLWGAAIDIELISWSVANDPANDSMVASSLFRRIISESDQDASISQILDAVSEVVRDCEAKTS